MKKKIKKYFVNPEDSAVLAMSVVDAPAVESNFIYLSKQKIDKFVALENKEKHMIFGCALRPDFPMYRNDGDEEYYLEFSKDAVERLARNFMINGLQQNFTAAHRSEVDGITITESWIKSDMSADKSVALGLDDDLPVGSWIIGAYCDNADIWEKVKAGTFHGFSVEAIVNVDELNFEEQVPEPAPVAEPVAAPAQEPVQEAPKERGILDKILALINGGDVKDVVETAKVPEKPTEIAPEEPKEPEVNDTPENEPEAVTEPETKPETQPEAQPNPLEEVINNLRAEIEELKKNNEALVTKIGEISKEPSAKPINTNAKPTGNDNGVDGSAFRAWRDKLRQMY